MGYAKEPLACLVLLNLAQIQPGNEIEASNHSKSSYDA